MAETRIDVGVRITAFSVLAIKVLVATRYECSLAIASALSQYEYFLIRSSMLCVPSGGLSGTSEVLCRTLIILLALLYTFYF